MLKPGTLSILPLMLSFLCFVSVLLEHKVRLLPHTHQLHSVLNIQLLNSDYFFPGHTLLWDVGRSKQRTNRTNSWLARHKCPRN